MNFNLKYAQIWQPSFTGKEYSMEGKKTFISYLHQLYEMEYKYNMLSSREFNGTPQRKENILEQLKGKFVEAAQVIVEQLQKTLYGWLQKHALLEPQTWSHERVLEQQDLAEMEESSTGYLINQFLDEHAKYTIYGGEWGQADYPRVWQAVLHDILANPTAFPMFSKVLEKLAIDFKEFDKDRILDDFEDFNATRNRSFNTPEEALKYIDSLPLNNYFDYIDDYGYGLAEFVKIIDQSGLVEPILKELYQHFVFPHWLKYWSGKGIEETRKKIQKVYDNLKTIDYNNLPTTSATINMALNSVHQSGKMLDYLTDDLANAGDGAADSVGTMLRSLTKGDFVGQANKQLKEIGVDVKKPIQNQQALVDKEEQGNLAKMQNNWYKVAQQKEEKPYRLCKVERGTANTLVPISRPEMKDVRIPAYSEAQALLKFRKRFPLVGQWIQNGHEIAAQVDEELWQRIKQKEQNKIDSSRQQFSRDWD